MNGDELGRHTFAERTGRSRSLEVGLRGDAGACLPTLRIVLPDTENAKLITPLPRASGCLQHQPAWGQEQVMAQLCALALPAQAGCGWRQRSRPYLAASGISCAASGAALAEAG